MVVYSEEISCFFFNDTATTEIYTLSLHDALPISAHPDTLQASVSLARVQLRQQALARAEVTLRDTLAAYEKAPPEAWERSEEHTSELQSRQYLVCRLLLEKKREDLQRDRDERCTE